MADAERTSAAGAPPEVSVILPVRDEAAHVGEQLEALSRQDFTGTWELIVADHGSRDGTDAIVLEWRPRFADLRLVDASAADGVGGVRNLGAASARSDRFVFCDGDNVADTAWLRTMVDGLRAHDIVTGRTDLTRLNPPDTRAYLPDAHQLRRAGGVPVIAGGNFGVRSAVWERLGGQRSDWKVGEDVDFGLRVNEAGLTISYLDDAVMHRRVPHTMAGVFRQHRGYGASQIAVRRAHPEIAERRSVARGIGRDVGTLVLRLPRLRHRAGRLHYAMVAGRLVGRVSSLTSFRLRQDRLRRAAS